MKITFDFFIKGLGVFQYEANGRKKILKLTKAKDTVTLKGFKKMLMLNLDDLRWQSMKKNPS